MVVGRGELKLPKTQSEEGWKRAAWALMGAKIHSQTDTVNAPYLIVVGRPYCISKCHGEVGCELSPRRKDKGLSNTLIKCPESARLYLLGKENSRPTGAAQFLFSKQDH